MDATSALFPDVFRAMSVSPVVAERLGGA